MKLFDQYLQVAAAGGASITTAIDEAEDLAQDADKTWTLLMNAIENVEERVASPDELRTLASSAGSSISELRYSMNKVLDAVHEICVWVANNVGGRPMDDSLTQIAVVLDPGQEYQLYHLMTDSEDAMEFHSTKSIILDKITRPMDVYSARECYIIADETAAACELLNGEIFSPNTPSRASFNTLLDKLRLMCTEVHVDADKYANLSMLLRDDPMGEHVALDELDGLRERYGANDARNLFNHIFIWIKNASQIVNAIGNNVALFSLAVDAVEDDKFSHM